MSIQWFRLLKLKIHAFFGDVAALHQLGAVYACYPIKGLSQEERNRIAVKYYRKGAKLGNAFCQYDLAFMLILKEAETEDGGEEIRRLLENSAAQQHQEAIKLLEDINIIGIAEFRKSCQAGR